MSENERKRKLTNELTRVSFEFQSKENKRKGQNGNGLGVDLICIFGFLTDDLIRFEWSALKKCAPYEGMGKIMKILLLLLLFRNHIM